MSKLTGGLNLYQGIGFLVSTLLGSGVFIVPSMVASITGHISWLPWLLMTVLILPVIFVFSWLGKKYPHNAGTAHFVELAFGKTCSKSISLLYLAITPVGPPVVIITGANYLAFCFGLSELSGIYFALLMIAIIFIINFFNIAIAGRIQFLSVIVTTIILGLVIFSGFFTTLAYRTPSDSGAIATLSDIAQAMGVIFWCFVGIEAVTHIAPEFKNPKKDFPLTIYISVFIVVLLYSLLCYSVLNFHAYGTEAKNISSLPFIIQQNFGRKGAILIGFMGFITCLGAVNLYILSLARLLVSLSKDKVLPAIFSHQNQSNVPVISTITVILVVLCTVLLKSEFKFTLQNLITCADGVFSLIYLASSLAAFKLMPHRKKILGFTASLFCLVVTFCLGREMIYASIIFTIGLLFPMVKKIPLYTHN